MIDFYGLASCDTCRKARAWLDDNGIGYRYHDVRSDGLAAQDLRAWSAALGWEALVNRRSTTWRELPDNLKTGMDEANAITALLEHPTLLKRPVVVGDGILELGFRPDRFTELFS